MLRAALQACIATGAAPDASDAPEPKAHLRKMLATVGERFGVGDVVLRRILNHAAPAKDVLHRAYVKLGDDDVVGALVKVQEALAGLMESCK